MRTCNCGSKVTTKYGRLCPACLFSARSMAGKSGAAKINYQKREAVKQAERRTQEVPTPTLARCPATLHDWIAMLPPSQIEKGIKPRLYCPQHESRRNISEAYIYGRPI